MKKEIKTIEGGMMRITTLDERWYAESIINATTGLPMMEFVPSVTWISGYYPKGIEFYKWLASKGWDESQALKVSAGIKGTKIHSAIDLLLDGEEIHIDSKLINSETGVEEELSPEEYEAILSFVDWFHETNPEIISHDIVVKSKEYGYAGTVDLICKINGIPYIIDFKSGKYIWTEYELQISAYKQAILENSDDYASQRDLAGQDIKLAILQVGYALNKKKFKLTEINDVFPLFLTAKQIWQKENSKVVPKQKDYPLSIKLNKK